MSTKRVLAIHDLCSFGRCSLTAAIPVISVLGSQVCPFPTAVFSNNLTYGEFTNTDLTPQMSEFLAMWEKLGFRYDAIYSGFLANAAQVTLVKETIARFAADGTLVVVDPAMADNGELYPVFDESIIGAMRTLIADAVLITPNYTEAALLLGEDPHISGIPTTKSLLQKCKDLSKHGPKRIIITSVPTQTGIKNISYDSISESFDEATTYKVPFATCGTGDLFTSTVTGLLLKCMDLHTAAETATKFLTRVLDYTHESGSDYREGVQVEPCLGLLATPELL
ncbi:pyridoxamine kinase [Colibacter massiliensis]|uniref:pyridoxamine kinase n=1 Tax=Colibacter massiliensis TaxID=1852379 RepID=UPI002356790A|nr:pyridoxamine kinase [Colibacter massiliensis]